jgi:putative ABC transport system substrate-binding protein
MRLTITGLVAALALLVLARPSETEAQPSPKGLPRIGLLLAAESPFTGAFEEGLRARGYVDGQNLLIERRTASGEPERLASLAADLVRLRVDAIVAPTTPAALAAQKATKTIPVVMVTASDPVGSGLVASLARPGGNVTGTTIMGTDLAAKRLDLLTQVLPGVSRVAILWSPSHRAQAPALKLALSATHTAAKTRGVTLVSLKLDSFEDFTTASAVIAKERPGALMVLPDPLSFAHRAQIVSFAGKHRLPGMYPEREYVEAGGLMAYAADLADLYRRAADYLDRILKGAKPADLPVEQPTKFELVINQKTAKILGIALPRSLLLQANQLID